MGQLRVQARPNIGSYGLHLDIHQMVGYPTRKLPRRVLRALIKPYRPAWYARCTAR